MTEQKHTREYAVCAASVATICAAPQIAAERDRLKALNAELVAALVHATRWCEHNGCGVGRTAEMPWLKDALAALAKVRNITAQSAKRSTGADSGD